jgi:hypothetical protein
MCEKREKYDIITRAIAKVADLPALLRKALQAGRSIVYRKVIKCNSLCQGGGPARIASQSVAGGAVNRLSKSNKM